MASYISVSYSRPFSVDNGINCKCKQRHTYPLHTALSMTIDIFPLTLIRSAILVTVGAFSSWRQANKLTANVNDIYKLDTNGASIVALHVTLTDRRMLQSIQRGLCHFQVYSLQLFVVEETLVPSESLCLNPFCNFFANSELIYEKC